MGRVQQDLPFGNCHNPTRRGAPSPASLAPGALPVPTRCASPARMNEDSWGGVISLALLVLWSLLLIIVLVNFLIAVVTNTFQAIKDREELQHLRNTAAVIDEIEGRTGGRQGPQQDGTGDRPFLHVLMPAQQADLQRGEGGAAQPEAQRILQLQKDLRGLVQGQQQLHKLDTLDTMLRKLLELQPGSNDKRPKGDGSDFDYEDEDEEVDDEEDNK